MLERERERVLKIRDFFKDNEGNERDNRDIDVADLTSLVKIQGRPIAKHFRR